MGRQKDRRPTMKRRRIASMTDLSAIGVHKAVVAACAGDHSIEVASADSSEMADLARALHNWQWLTRRSKAEEPQKLRRGEIVAGISKVLKNGPAEVQDMVRDMRALEAASPSDRAVLEIARAVALLPRDQASVRRLAALIFAAEEVANDPNLVGPDKWASRPLDSFEHYVGELRLLFDRVAGRLGDGAAELQWPFFTFAAAALSVVLATSVTAEAVRSHVMRDRPVRWSRRGWRDDL